MSRLVVWVDPGLLSGVAWYDLDAQVYGSMQGELEDVERKLTKFCDSHADRLALGYERYIITSRARLVGSPEHAMSVIERIERLAEDRGITLLPPRVAADRMLGSVVMLRRLGWYKPGMVHANDAGQHVLAHLLRLRPRMPEEIRTKLFPGYVAGVTIAP